MPLFRRHQQPRERGTSAGADTGPRQRVRVVTDSTSCLPVKDVHASRGEDPIVVPLRVLTEHDVYSEGVDISVTDVTHMLDNGARVTTSQPPPEQFVQVYRELAAGGAREVVSVHLSEELSGTVAAAHRAAARSPVVVEVVDSRMVGLGLGFAVRAAAQCAAEGCNAEHVAARARDVAASAHSIFAPDTLEYLRRGGRLSNSAAMLGTMLGMRPLLTVRQGKIELLQRVRTRTAGMERLLAMASEAIAAAATPLVGVQHYGALEQAGTLAGRLRTRTRASVEIAEMSSVLGVHVGPGTVAVVVADGGEHRH